MLEFKEHIERVRKREGEDGKVRSNTVVELFSAGNVVENGSEGIVIRPRVVARTESPTKRKVRRDSSGGLGGR